MDPRQGSRCLGVLTAVKGKKRFVFLWSCVGKESLAYFKNETDFDSAPAGRLALTLRHQVAHRVIILVTRIARRRKFKCDEAVSTSIAD